jgi:hypothetical protein
MGSGPCVYSYEIEEDYPRSGKPEAVNSARTR